MELKVVERVDFYKEMYDKQHGGKYDFLTLVKFLKDKRIISGKYDIAGGFVVFFIKGGIKDEHIHRFLKHMYGDKYNEELAKKVIESTRERINNKKSVTNISTVLMKVRRKSIGLCNELKRLLNEMIKNKYEGVEANLKLKYDSDLKDFEKINFSTILNVLGLPMASKEIFTMIVNFMKGKGYLFKRICGVWMFIKEKIQELYEDVVKYVHAKCDIIKRVSRGNYRIVVLDLFDALKQEIELMMNTLMGAKEEMMEKLGFNELLKPLMNKKIEF